MESPRIVHHIKYFDSRLEEDKFDTSHGRDACKKQVFVQQSVLYLAEGFCAPCGESPEHNPGPLLLNSAALFSPILCLWLFFLYIE